MVCSSSSHTLYGNVNCGTWLCNCGTWLCNCGTWLCNCGDAIIISDTGILKLSSDVASYNYKLSVLLRQGKLLIENCPILSHFNREHLVYQGTYMFMLRAFVPFQTLSPSFPGHDCVLCTGPSLLWHWCCPEARPEANML